MVSTIMKSALKTISENALKLSDCPIKPGLYRHYKGDRYNVMGMADNVVTGERMVLCISLRGSKFSVWSLEMFLKPVKIAGVQFQRFSPVRRKKRRKN
ncbi:MAG: DUF1653 domain-containing protein [Candidatus Pacebacteria bacterium]|nr:DUF1653 domain-containing protein [Candidatus Paceibacterota bacterium]